jgi:simple sugar transport system substrate-binding protein
MTITKRLMAALVTTAVMATSATAVMAQDGANIFVVGGSADDPFWSIVKRGADDAGKVVEAQGGSVTWLGPLNYDNLGPDAADLIRTALSQNPDAIVGADWVPDAMDEAFKAVVDAGVPLIIYNAGGIEAADRLGAMNYIGSDEYVAGVAGGEYFGTHGSANVLCINNLPGHVALEARCKGIADGIAKHGGKSKQLPLPATLHGDRTATAEAIKGALVRDPAIDGVVTTSAESASSAAVAISQAGVVDSVQLGTFDMDEATLQRIEAGTQLFAIDQQPYLQGYLAVSLLNGFVNYGLDVPTSPILTGPGMVDIDNVKATLAGVKAGAR